MQARTWLVCPASVAISCAPSRSQSLRVLSSEADTNRVQHGVPKSVRNLAQARVDKDKKTADAHKLSKDEEKQLSTLLKEVESILIDFIYGGELTMETRKFIV